jgi:hypothetical protein
MTLQPEIQRCVLGVPGMPYSLLLSRSVDFDPFFMLFQAEYPDQRDITFWMALIQNVWDSADPGGMGRQFNEEPLDGVAHEVLIQDALGDYQVTTLGAHLMARAYGADMLEPPVREIWGIDVQPAAFVGNGIVEYDFGNPEPFENIPPEDLDADPHSGPRKSFLAQEQLWHFLTTGEVAHYCDGPCDPD